MSFHFRGVALALACALAGGTAAAKQVLDQPGAFQIALPDDFKVTKHGRGKTMPGSYVLHAQSLAGNVKLFANSAMQGDPSVPFAQKFALWEARARKYRWYDVLKPVTGIVRARTRIPTFFRSYDAMGTRHSSKQLYRVLLMMSRHPETRRLYTVAVASQADYFKANQARVMALAASFQPLVATAAKKTFARGPVKKVSLRGRLLARGGKVEARGPKAPPPKVAQRKNAPRRLTPAEIAARKAAIARWQAQRAAAQKAAALKKGAPQKRVYTAAQKAAWQKQRAAQWKAAQDAKAKGAQKKPAAKPLTAAQKAAAARKAAEAKRAAGKKAAAKPVKLAPGVKKDAKGKLVDQKGRAVDAEGHRLDKNGKHLVAKEAKTHDKK